MSVTVVDNDIVKARRFQSMHGTDACWNCDSDYGQHNNGYCPSMDEDFASTPHPSAYYRTDDDDNPFDYVEPGLGRIE